MQRWKVGEMEESKREKGNKEFREKKKTCRKKKGIKEGHTKGGGGEERGGRRGGKGREEGRRKISPVRAK